MSRLERAKRDHDARILLAIESGSRAWGFPSPDSDFDVRFLYVLPRRAYLGLTPPRDVIEQPIEGLYDINGWDLRKALNLMLKANPILCEWMRSPVVYMEEPGFSNEIRALIDQIDERPAASHHHLSLLRSNYQRQIENHETIKLKKYFYCLRPAYALHWMWENSTGPLPMTFAALREGVTEPAERAANIDKLLQLKASTREIGEAPRLDILDKFFESTIERAKSMNLGRQPAPAPAFVEACENLLLGIIDV